MKAVVRERRIPFEIKVDSDVQIRERKQYVLSLRCVRNRFKRGSRVKS